MKLRIINFRQVALTVFLLICYQCNVLSQKTDSTLVKQPGLFVGFGLGPCHPQIKNEGTQSVSNLISSNKRSLFGSVEIGYSFSNHFGLSSGIGFISYNTQLTLDTYQDSFNTIDSEKEAYERRVSGSGIREEQKTGFLNVPVCINIRLPFNKTIGLFIQPGVNLSIALSRRYKSSGIFTFKGYYPADNVLIENLPAYGFPSNITIDIEGELKVKPLVFNAIASAGFDITIGGKFQIALAACFDRSLSNISDYTSPDDFILSSDGHQINSFMGGYSETATQSIGLKLIFKYYMN